MVTYFKNKHDLNRLLTKRECLACFGVRDKMDPCKNALHTAMVYKAFERAENTGVLPKMSYRTRRKEKCGKRPLPPLQPFCLEAFTDGGRTGRATQKQSIKAEFCLRLSQGTK